jgi:ABC-2 type transport system permease protein
MKKNLRPSLSDSLNIIWTITAKDIVDALKNRVVVSMLVMLSVVLLIPRMMPLIFEKKQFTLPIYDLGNSSMLAELRNNPQLSVQRIFSEADFESVLCGSIDPQIGLKIPVEFEDSFSTLERIELQGYVCWGKRNQATELQVKLEEILTGTLGKKVTVHVKNNIVYPPSSGTLSYGLMSINSILLVLMMGVFLVPSLLFEEKETKTIQALLVSPASIGQVVLGKALAGFFYILVSGAMIFLFIGQDVTHWSMVLLFIFSGGLFSVAVGLMLGSFFEKQQDIMGLMIAILLFLVGALLLKMLGMELPAVFDQVLPWIPSVAIAEICRAAFAHVIQIKPVMINVGIVLWKVNRSDR